MTAIDARVFSEITSRLTSIDSVRIRELMGPLPPGATVDAEFARDVAVAAFIKGYHDGLQFTPENDGELVEAMREAYT